MKQRADSINGYSLLEVMIAMVIAAIMFSGIYMVSIQTMNILTLTRDESRAIQAAQYEMEKIRSYSWSVFTGSASEYTVTSGDNEALGYLKNATITVKKDPYVVAGITEPIYAITVRVNWTSYDGNPITKTVTSLATARGVMR